MTIDEGRYDDNVPIATAEEALVAAHHISKYIGNETKYVKDFLRNKKTPFTTLLEQAFAEKMGARYAIALNSDMSALYMALVVSGVGRGDEVIVPALSPAIDTLAMIYCGATPVFADANPDTFNMDWIDVADKITTKTKTLIDVSLYGLPAQGTYFTGFSTIIDNAQCIPGKQGDLAIFSFETSKHLSTGEGGMVVTDGEMLARKVRELGHSFKMPEICAAVGLAQIERVEELVGQRQTVAKLYEDALARCEWLIPQRGEGNTYYTYAVKLMGDVKWKEFYNKYKELGGDRFYSADMTPYYDGDCPVAEDLQRRLMLFKTNYRSLELAKRKADALNKTIQWFD